MSELETLTGYAGSLETKQTAEGTFVEFWIESGATRSPARAAQSQAGLVRERAHLQVTGRRDHNGVLVAETIRPAGTAPPITPVGWWSEKVAGVPRWALAAASAVIVAIMVAVALGGGDRRPPKSDPVKPDPVKPDPKPVLILKSGKELRVKIQAQLSSQFSKVGTTFQATTVAPVHDGDVLLVPVETQLLGRVSAARAMDISTGTTAVLSIAFDSIILNNVNTPGQFSAPQPLKTNFKTEIRDRNLVFMADEATLAKDVVKKSPGFIKLFRPIVIGPETTFRVTVERDIPLPD